METPFKKPPITEIYKTTFVQLIQGRRKTEQALLASGELSFEALKSNSGLLPDKSEVAVSNPKEIDECILKLGREADKIVSDGLRQELEKHGLQPDGKTYLYKPIRANAKR